MRYSRTFPSLLAEDLDFFTFNPDTPSEADTNCGDSTFARTALDIESIDLTDDVEHITLGWS